MAESQMAQYINGKWSEDMAQCPDANVHLADGGGGIRPSAPGLQGGVNEENKINENK